MSDTNTNNSSSESFTHNINMSNPAQSNTNNTQPIKSEAPIVTPDQKVTYRNKDIETKIAIVEVKIQNGLAQNKNEEHPTIERGHPILPSDRKTHDMESFWSNSIVGDLFYVTSEREYHRYYAAAYMRDMKIRRKKIAGGEIRCQRIV